MMTCDVCGKTAKANTHPCRFEKACKCWYGVACERGESYRAYIKAQKA